MLSYNVYSRAPFTGSSSGSMDVPHINTFPPSITLCRQPPTPRPDQWIRTATTALGKAFDIEGKESTRIRCCLERVNRDVLDHYKNDIHSLTHFAQGEKNFAQGSKVCFTQRFNHPMNEEKEEVLFNTMLQFGSAIMLACQHPTHK